jgi:hypothetical protein
MSRLDDEVKNPAKAFLQWDGTNGGFNYWDKSKGEKGEKVHVNLPFGFMALDTLATVKGYSDSAKSGFWSNEVRNTQRDKLTVRTKAGIAATGLYSDVMANKACTGAKFCQSVYVVAVIDGKTCIANLQMMGTALSAWIDFTKANNKYKGAIMIDSMKEGKKGVTKYQTPIFKAITSTPDADAQALEMGKELKAYLEVYLGAKQKETEIATEDNS